QGPSRRVRHLRVELDAVEAAALVGDHRIGAALGGGDHLEAQGDGGDLVAMAHPDGFLGARLAEAAQQRAPPLAENLVAARRAISWVTWLPKSTISTRSWLGAGVSGITGFPAGHEARSSTATKKPSVSELRGERRR